jgi:hypothetical protein
MYLCIYVSVYLGICIFKYLCNRIFIRFVLQKKFTHVVSRYTSNTALRIIIP